MNSVRILSHASRCVLPCEHHGMPLLASRSSIFQSKIPGQSGICNNKISTHTRNAHDTCSPSNAYISHSSRYYVSKFNQTTKNTAVAATSNDFGSTKKVHFPQIQKLRSSTTGASPKQELLTQIFRQNQVWKSESEFQFKENVENVLLLQKPQCTLLTCCDSRAPSAALGLTEANQNFEIRNIGNQSTNALGSIEYGLEVLKTPYLLIMGHTNCGAVIGALSDYRNLHTMIQKELLSLVKAIRFAEYVIDSSADGTGSGSEQLDTDYFRRINILSEINVDFQVLQLLDDWKVKKSVTEGDLTIAGLMFDIHDMYGKGYGQIHFVNINGDTDPDVIKSNSLFKDLTDEDKDTAVGRLFEYPPDFQYRSFSE